MNEETYVLGFLVVALFVYYGSTNDTCKKYCNGIKKQCQSKCKAHKNTHSSKCGCSKCGHREGAVSNIAMGFAADTMSKVKKAGPSLIQKGNEAFDNVQQAISSRQVNRSRFAGGSANSTGDAIMKSDTIASQEPINIADSLEVDIAKSHNEYLAGSTVFGQGVASMASVRDDPNDINPWVGLRPPRYHTQAQPQEGTRVISSELPSNLRYTEPSCLV